MSVKIEKIGTTIRKGFGGWEGKTYYRIIDGPHSGRQVKVSTYKGYNGLYTSAQVVTVEEKLGYATESFTMFSDPNTKLVPAVKCRVTEGTVLAQHTQGLAILEGENGTDWLK